MKQFIQFSNGKDLFIGVDFGRGEDFAVETIMQKQSNGRLIILSSNIIGRSADMSEERKEQICKRYERLYKKEAVE